MIVGILQADDVDQRLQPQFGNYFEMVRDTMCRGRLVDAEFQVYRVVDGHLPTRIAECDGYIVTGSRCSVYDELDWIRDLEECAREIIASESKLVGICFGHQLVASALDGEVVKAPNGWCAGVHEYRIERSLPWMNGSVARLKLNAIHQDQVVRLPRGAQRYASSAMCANAGFTIGDNVVTTQGHPEFGRPYLEALLLRRRERLGEAFEPALQSLSVATDQDQFCGWLERFLVDD